MSPNKAIELSSILDVGAAMFSDFVTENDDEGKFWPQYTIDGDWNPTP